MVFGRHFLENKWNEAVTSREKTKPSLLYLLLMIKFALWTIKFWLLSATMSLTARKYLDASNEISGSNYQIGFKKLCVMTHVYM